MRRFFSPIHALAVCETTTFSVPTVEQATKQRFGIWPVISAKADFTP